MTYYNYLLASTLVLPYYSI